MKRFALAAVLAAAAATAQAAPQAWICKLKDYGDGGFPMTEVAFMIDSAQNRTLAFDAYQMHYNGAPAEAKMTRKSAGLRFTWRARNIEANPVGRISIAFRADLNPATGAIEVHGRIPNYGANRLSGAGSCKVVDVSALTG